MSLASARISDSFVIKKIKFEQKKFGIIEKKNSRIVNFEARILSFSSKWLWEKSSSGFAIISGNLVMKNESLTKNILGSGTE